MKTCLVTGCAGFIGSHLVDRLLAEGFEVTGVDNFNDYYDPKIKEGNLKNALKSKAFELYKIDILDFGKLHEIFSKVKPQKVVHLAARAGVRPSIANPKLYAQVNVLGTVNMLKLAVDYNIEQFIFGSSSSVYGQSPRLPFTEDDPCDAIISPYGSSKRSAEFFVETFYRNFKLKTVILRLFTVYGPRGRPDMAPALFTKAILESKSINQFGDGSSSRDYTYVDDIVDGIVRAIDKNFDFEIINLGNNHPVRLTEFISTLEKVIGKKAKVNKLPIQQGDVEKTWAGIQKARNLLEWEPKTDILTGIKKYIRWLKTL
ncbi:MAG: CapI [Candidatus Curtissbacteria bacterium GW2011_GWC2_38_9]|uniref:Epimerase n=3 Tax=Candidatus Curtissiibacteriota TaxID=1752717 RepID=A0A1F5HPK8_9BACT|nr:MAG: CapI [Candidatus Curtissbacteria bacterium GW2011_GWC2_38_9]KKS04435.1 MAG: CapI [Candidatus Curtissbacteria bacterium GW2011_GWA2_41_24]OGD89602.1 MAG: epimerase [Candidatus Curtissbacteria bacterium RIFCSPHIGHO2_02_39_8]OGE06097.1 MAG: epimerase [Candidatus Curtissbacteria bacterium RIFCSPLOWO2_02_41_11]